MIFFFFFFFAVSESQQEKTKSKGWMCEASLDFVCLFVLCVFHALTKLCDTTCVGICTRRIRCGLRILNCLPTRTFTAYWGTKSHHQILSLQQFYYKSPPTPDLMIPSLRNGISSISSKRKCLLYFPIYALFLRVYPYTPSLMRLLECVVENDDVQSRDAHQLFSLRPARLFLNSSFPLLMNY